MASLSSLPNLKNISITSNTASWHLPGQEVLESEIPKSWEFSKLESLTLLRQHAPALSLILSRYTFHRLSRLEISVWSDIAIEGKDLDLLFSTIASVGSLDTLSIGVDQSATEPSRPLPVQAMISALSALRLKDLKITHARPLDLSLPDVNQLAQDLGPSIEVLQLNPYPARGSVPPPLDLGALTPFAQHCLKHPCRYPQRSHARRHYHRR